MKTVLILEDNQETLQMYLELVQNARRQQEIAFHFARSEKEGYEVMRHLDELDAVIADGTLNPGDSLQFIVHLHANNPTLPIIAASSDADMRAKQLELGCSHEVEKKQDAISLVISILGL